MDMDNVISNLEQQIRWIEEIECHKFPGWLNVTNAIRDALSMLKEYDTQVQYRDDHIAEYEKEIKRLNKLVKEQEAQKVTWWVGRAHCPSCGELFPKKQDKQYIRFCNYCGQAVKWE